MSIREKTLFAAAGFLFAAFMIASPLRAEVTETKTIKMNQIYGSELSAGIQTVLNVAEETDVHEEITEVLNQGVVQNNLLGYDWNNMAMANVEEYVNMRMEPSEEAEVVGRFPKGAAGTITDGTEGWTKISSGSVEGWISDQFLLFGVDAEAKAEELGSYQAQVNAEVLRIRKEPSEDAGIFDLAEMGSSYKVAEQLEGWVGIQLKDSVGYVSAEYVNVEFKLAAAMSMEEIQAEEARKAKEAEAKKRAEAEKKAANSSDVALLAALVQLEAGGESYEGKLAVASVVMNRVRSGGYPNSVSGVIYQSGQFPPASSGRMAALVAGGASADCVKAAKQAIGGVSNVGGLTHFHSARLGGSLVIGNHAFY